MRCVKRLTAAVDGGNGTVVMAPGSTLFVSGQNEGFGSQLLGALNATATNCTVVYQGNSFWAKRADYWNLVFNGWGDFYNGAQNGYPATPMTIHGNFFITGTNVPSDQPNYTGCYVQCGDWVTVLGNLYIAASNTFDCSTSIVEVVGYTTCAGALFNAGGGQQLLCGRLDNPFQQYGDYQSELPTNRKMDQSRLFGTYRGAPAWWEDKYIRGGLVRGRRYRMGCWRESYQ